MLYYCKETCPEEKLSLRKGNMKCIMREENTAFLNLFKRNKVA